MVLISGQRFTAADTAVRIGRAAFFFFFWIKGAQLNFGVKIGQISLLFHRNSFMTGYFVLKGLVILNIVPRSMDTCRELAFI